MLSDNKKVVFLTGATGYIGSQLTKRLVTEGHEVHILTRPLSSLSMLHEVEKHISVHCYDGTYQSIENAISSVRPDIVFHLAAYAKLTYEPSEIEGLIKSNILLGTHLVEAMTKNKVTNLVNTSSFSQHYQQEVYLPNSLYAATKQAFEDILRYYTTFANLKVVSLTLFDNYGPDDPRPKLMNLLYKAAINQTELKMSPGEQLLDLLYIDDVINAYVIAGNRLLEERNLSVFEKFQVRSNRPLKLKQIVQLFEEISAFKLLIHWGGINYREGEIMIPWQGEEILPNWKPYFSLKEGLKRFLLLIRKN
ncbi:NAD-dependent epimerase/dehydratase family protein [Bacillus alkalicellulosilyticus]|uniref:NAD-dependent epimerase/dehydratase family protein n=1 Tax=Alkalihalobacterium alkalicellulosilyticum TaxID=1912214 RepID=UPI000998428F|nr:NAD-dependent epimerase/dehydratase family protein [Bacillus alkalicellulosilyticus]